MSKNDELIVEPKIYFSSNLLLNMEKRKTYSYCQNGGCFDNVS